MQDSNLERDTLLCMGTHISPVLTDLQLYHCPEMTDELLLPILQRLSSLDALYINNSPVTNASLTAIAVLHPHLCELRLDGCANVSLEGIRAVTQACTELGLLGLDRCPLVGNECIAAIAAHTAVTTLSLADCEGITDECMLALGTHLHTLEDVDLSHNASVTDESVMFLLERCPHLTNINLRGRGGVHMAVVAGAAQRGVSLAHDAQHNHTCGGFQIGENGVLSMSSFVQGHTGMVIEDHGEEIEGGDDEEEGVEE